MKNTIILFVLLSLGLFESCTYHEDVAKNTILPSQENILLTKDFIPIKTRTLFSGNDFLYFEDGQALLDYYDNLQALSDSWDYESEDGKEYNESVNGDPAIEYYNSTIDFMSLGQYYNILDEEDESFRDNVGDYIGSPVLQDVLSYRKEVAVGNRIFKYLTMRRIAVINDLSIEGLEAVRENGIHTYHDKVEYYDMDKDEIHRLDPPNEFDDDDPLDFCNTFLSVVTRTFKGSLANKVQINARIIGLPTECYGAVTSTIDWGDGTTTYGLNSTHTYQVPNFAIGECEEFTIKITSEWIQDCGACEKGKKHVRTFKIKLCPEQDCTSYTGPGYRSKIFDYAWQGNQYRIVGEIGIDNSIFILTDWSRDVWAKSTLYRKRNGKWKKWTPSRELGVRIHGSIWMNPKCLLNKHELESSKFRKKKQVSHKVSFNPSSTIHSKEFEDDKVFSDHIVRMGATFEESILDLTLFD